MNQLHTYGRNSSWRRRAVVASMATLVVSVACYPGISPLESNKLYRNISNRNGRRIVEYSPAGKRRLLDRIARYQSSNGASKVTRSTPKTAVISNHIRHGPGTDHRSGTDYRSTVDRRFTRTSECGQCSRNTRHPQGITVGRNHDYVSGLIGIEGPRDRVKISLFEWILINE